MPRILDPEKVSPLLALLRQCSAEERIEFAELAGSGVTYLYMLASGRRKPLAETALRIINASIQMNEKTKGRLSVLTLEDFTKETTT